MEQAATIKMALMIAEAKEMMQLVQVIKVNLGVLLMEKHMTDTEAQKFMV
jgi:hypothetical protein